MSSRQPQVAVVGAGPGGLVTALLLARAGRRVRVLEAAGEPGGRSRSPLLAGVPINLGAHALYRHGPAEEVLSSLDVPLPGWQPAPSDTWFWHQGRFVEAPVGPRTLLGPGPLPWSSRWQLLRRLLGLSVPERAPGSAEAWLATVEDAQARAVLATLGRVASYSNAPGLVPAAFVARQLKASLAGVLYLEGGWTALVGRLLSRCREAGVEVCTGQRVAGVEEDGARVRLAEGPPLVVEATVLATGLTQASRLFPGLRDFAARAVPSRVATLDLVLEALPAPGRRLVFSTDAPLYFSVHSARGRDPVLAHAMWTLAPGDRGAEVRAPLEAWLDLVQPGWRAHVLGARFLPELRALDALPSLEEAPPGPRLGRRLFAVGDWTQGGALLDGALNSARAVAGLVLEGPAARAAPSRVA
jgi:phytoene dehydrogenase-like protein